MAERLADALFRIKAKEIEKLKIENARLAEALRYIMSSGVEFADDCLHYVVMQVDKVEIDAARAALAATDSLKWLEGEKRKARRDAERIIRRGIKAAERETWEEGQTQAEWIDEARQFVGVEELHREIDRAAELEGGRG